jgi:hypothetical protein
MLISLLCWLSAAAPVPAEKPQSVRLLADDAVYLRAAELEAVYEGVLERRSGGPTLTFRLVGQEGGKPVVWPLYLPTQPERLTPFVGKRVRVRGKLIVAANRIEPDLWPARLEAAATTTLPAGRDGVAARSPWQPESARRAGVRQFVVRDARQLAEVMKLDGRGAEETAIKILARELGVEKIDWERQMVVCVAGGLRGPEVDRLTITHIVREGSGMTVFYKLEKDGNGAGGFGYPAETVLIDRHDGPVRFEDESAGKK